MFEEYKELCTSGEIAIGRVHVWSTGSLLSPLAIINLPTKKHWRSRSRLEHIDASLASMADAVVEGGFRSIAMPPPGCGNGGLDWVDVKPLVAKHLGKLTDVDVQVYLPAHILDQSSTREQRLTPQRAALLSSLFLFQLASGKKLDERLVHWIAFLLQRDGLSLNLKFHPTPDGLKAPGLETVLVSLDGLDIQGYCDGDSQGFDVNRNALPVVDKILAANSTEKLSVERVSRLFKGEDPAPHLELAVALIWNAQNEPAYGNITGCFSDAEIRRCRDELQRLGWISSEPAD